MREKIAALEQLFTTLTAEVADDDLDEWERGYNAGMWAAGRELAKILGGAA